MNKKLKIAIIFSILIFSIAEKNYAEVSKLNHSEEKALDYYSAFKAIVVCEISKIFLLQKVTTEKNIYYEYVVIVKVLKSIKGNLKTESQVACMIRYSDPELELNANYFLGFDGPLNKVFVLENDNLCPVLEISRRNR